MSSSIALFRGRDSGHQLLQIYSLLGLPSERDWSDFRQYPLWGELCECHLDKEKNAPKNNGITRTLSQAVPNLDEDGRKLLLVKLPDISIHISMF
jgi:hypothetical protein